jgi:hypothetical protein
VNACRRKTVLGLFALILSTLTVYALLIAVFPPEKYPDHYFSCQFRKVTGMLCPGCGGQRAVYCLLSGQFRSALSYNSFVVLCVIPLMVKEIVALGFVLARTTPLERGKESGVWRLMDATSLWLFFLITVCFGVFRNL